MHQRPNSVQARHLPLVPAGFDWPLFAMLAVGFALLYGPVYADLASTTWTTDEQGHGPIILAVSAWLLYARRHTIAAAPYHPLPAAGWPLLVFAALLFAFGRSQDIIMFQVSSQIVLLAALLLIFRGAAALRAAWFPLFFMIFMLTDAVVATYQRHHLDALVCLGGGGTQKNALRLVEAGLNVVTLPKTIDNDIALTDRSFGFDTALGIATEAIDRLHSTATSHERIIVVEVMGHRAGWLALEAGIAGGADVILLPEIPYDVEKVAAAIRQRTQRGRRFSIVVVAEGAMSVDHAGQVKELLEGKAAATEKPERAEFSERLKQFHEEHVGHTIALTRNLEKLTGQESRLTILGHLQRGGTPSAADRVLASWLGTECARVLDRGQHGVMLALQAGSIVPVPIADVAGRKRLVPVDHPLIAAARMVGTCFGD